MFQFLQINPQFFKRKAYLEWEFNGTADQFTVQRSRYPSSGFKTLAVVGTDTTYADESFVLDGNLEQYFYKVIATAPGMRVDSFPISWQTNPVRSVYGAAAAALYQEERSLRRHTPLTIWKQLATGTPCPDCTDPETSQKLASTLCETCYGTGYQGGYDQMVCGFGRIQTRTAGVTQDTPAGTDSPDLVLIRMVPYPRARRGDLVEDGHSRRLYVVDTVRQFFMANQIPIACEVNATLLPASDVRYRVQHAA